MAGTSAVSGKIGVPVAGGGQLRPRRGNDLQGRPVIEREGLVFSGFGEPQVDQLAYLFRVSGGQVVQLGPVGMMQPEGG